MGINIIILNNSNNDIIIIIIVIVIIVIIVYTCRSESDSSPRSALCAPSDMLRICIRRRV